MTSLPDRSSADDRRRRDNQRYLDEWRLWFVVSLILTGVWAFLSWRAERLTFFWPTFVIGIWAALLIVAPFFHREEER